MEDHTTGASRRTLLGAAAMAAPLLGLLSASAAKAADWTAAETANVKVVNDFLAANKPKDFTPALAFLAPDCAYRMIETLPFDVGHAAITARLRPYIDNADKIDFQILATFAAGPIVINHRIDTFTSTVMPLKFEGVGVFFIKGGKIKEWTDYTIKVG